MLFIKGTVIAVMMAPKVYDFEAQDTKRRIQGASAKVLVGDGTDQVIAVSLSGSTLGVVEAAMKGIKIGSAVEWPVAPRIENAGGVATMKCRLG